MIEFRELVKWYEDQVKLGIKKGNLPKDVTPDEALEYMEFVYCSKINELEGDKNK